MRSLRPERWAVGQVAPKESVELGPAMPVPGQELERERESMQSVTWYSWSVQDAFSITPANREEVSLLPLLVGVSCPI